MELARGRALPGVLWVGPGEEAIALVDWETPAHAGRRVAIYVDSAYRSETALTSLMRGVHAEYPIRAVDDPILGFSSRQLAEVLGPLGFGEVRRVDMVYPVTEPLPQSPSVPEGPSPRTIAPDDAAALAELVDAAYADNPVDRALFRQWPDPAADARALVDDLLADRVGRWVRDASFGVWDGARAVAATIVTDLHGPLIAEVMVAPSHRRRGLARRLLRHSLAALRSMGAGEPRLVVTLGNDRAVALYESFGFLRRPETEGAIWLRAS